MYRIMCWPLVLGLVLLATVITFSRVWPGAPARLVWRSGAA